MMSSPSPWTSMLFVAVICLPRPGAGDVRITKTVEIKSLASAETIRVVNRLGEVSLEGWDRPYVRITAVKRAVNKRLGERLRVGFLQYVTGDIRVRTHLRLLPRRPRTFENAMQMVRAQRDVLLRQMGGPRALARFRSDLERFLRQMKQDTATMTQNAGQLFGGPHSPSTAGEQPGIRLPGSVPVSSGRVDLTMKVPRTLQVMATTFKHGITVSGITGGMNLVSEEGPVIVRDSKGRVVTRTQKGEQRVIAVEGPVTIEGGAADVFLRKIRGPVRVVLISGDIDARDLRGARVVLQTVMGNIHIEGRWAAGAKIRLMSRAGTLRVVLDRRDGFELRGQAASWRLGGVKIRSRKKNGSLLTGCIGDCGTSLELYSRKGTVNLVLAPSR